MSHHPDTHMEQTSNQKTIQSYVTGFILSLLLTGLAFTLVMQHLLSDTARYINLALLAVIQLVVQCMCFLRLNSSDEGKWNLLPFLFTILIICILAGGSLWIMYNLNYYMMH